MKVEVVNFSYVLSEGTHVSRDEGVAELKGHVKHQKDFNTSGK